MKDIKRPSDFRARLHRVPRERVIEESRALFRDVFADDTDEGSGCLYWTACVVFVAARYGLRLAVQAGTATYLRLPDHLDDGVVDTHFSYVWSDDEWPDVRVVDTLRHSRCLPELHVWAADPLREEIVDLTTKFLPEQSESCTGQPWLAPKPPDYLWAHYSRLPYKWGYEPSERATHIAMAIMRNSAMPEIRERVRQLEEAS